MGIQFLCDKRTLIPRRETEILGRKALEISIDLAKKKKCVRVMDICAGSGNLDLAIAYYNPKTIVFATDLSHEAAEHSKDNISFLNLHDRVQAEQGDLFLAFEKEEHYAKADIIVCNPPYISTGKVAKMNSKFPAMNRLWLLMVECLELKYFKNYWQKLQNFLLPNGWLLFEVGLGQGPFIKDLCERTGNYQQIEAINDANNHIRVIMAQKKS